MTDLLPCPFCGSNNLRYEFAGSRGYMECNECGAQGPCDERAADPICSIEAARAAWNRRAALAQPEPVAPTLMEIVALADEVEEEGLGQVDLVRRALARWGRPAIEPVPVAERLPGPEDCDADGRCWWWADQLGDYDDDWGWKPLDRTYGPRWGASHWLPHHALPVPQQEVE